MRRFLALDSLNQKLKFFKSEDHGATWHNIGASLPDIPINDLETGETEGTIYLASDIGVFYSPNDGENFWLMGEGLPNVPTLDVDFDLGSHTLAVATFGRGMYTLDVADVTDVDEEVLERIELYPNPAESWINIKSSVVQSYEIFDMRGHLMKRGYESRINVEALVTGTYTIVLHVDDVVSSKVFIKH